MMKIRFCLSIFFIFLISFSCLTSASEGEPASGRHFQISTIETRPLYIDKLVYSAFENAGYNAVFSAGLSLQQGYEMADAGERDGAISSTQSMEQMYPNLVRIPVKLENTNIIVLMREDAKVKIDDWSGLSKRRVGILSGRIYIESKIPEDSVLTVKETTSGLLEGLLKYEYEAVVLSVRDHEILRLPDGIVQISRIDRLDEFLYMHKSLEAYIPKITESLEAMFADGRAEKILNGSALPGMYSKKTILHLISTSTNVEREDIFNTSIRERFKDDDTIEWYTIELNSLRFSADAERLSYYAYLIRRDFTARDLTAILASGDAAQDFLNEYYNLLFRNVPVLFYGVDESRVSEFEALCDSYTGIIEKLSVKETVSKALELFPNTSGVFVLNDFTPKGLKYREDMYRQLQPFSDRLEITFCEDLERSLILAQMRDLPDSFIVLAGGYFVDANEQYYSTSEMKTAIEANCSVPVFTIFSTELPYSATGGKCLDYEKYGEILGTSLRRILDGEKAENIPIVSDAEAISRWVFDDNLLDSFHARKSVLPDGAELLNKPPSVWETNPLFAYTAVISSVFFTLIIMGLFVFLGRYKKQNMELLETRKTLHTKEELLEKDAQILEVSERMRRLILSAPVSYMLVVDGEIAELNDIMKANTGLDVGGSAKSVFTERGEYDIIAAGVLFEGFITNNIVRMNFADGSSHRCVLSAVQTEYEQNRAIVIWAVDIEDNELKTDELMAARESLQSIIDTLPVPVSITDIESYKPVYCNKNYLELKEISGVEELGRLDSEQALRAIHSVETDTQELIDTLMRSTGPLSNEVELTTAGGARIGLRLITCPIEYKGRKSVLAIMVDLSQEREIKAMQQSLQSILDTLPQPIRITNSSNHTVIYVNNSCAKLFGYNSPADMTGLSIADMLPEFQSDGTHSAYMINSIHYTNEPLHEEIEYVAADGRIIDARLLSYPIEFMGVRATIGMITDLAEELEQRRMRESLQNVLDALPIPVRIVDIEQKTLVYVNKSFAEMFEYESPEMVIGNSFSTIVPVLQRDGVPTLKKLEQVISAKEILQTEIEYVSAKGKIIDSMLTAVIIDFHGKKSSLGIIKDLSVEKEQKRMRRSLQHIMDTMPIPVNVVDEETRKLLYGNDAYIKMQGHDSIDDIIWTSISKIIAPNQDDKMTPDEFIDFVMSADAPVVKEVRIITAGGKLADIRLHTRKIDYLGRSSVIGVMTDLSSEKEYKSIQMSLQTVLDLLPIPVMISDIENQAVIYANNRTVSLFKEDTLSGMKRKRLTDYMPETQPDGKNSCAMVNSLRLYREPISGEFTCMNAKGGLFEALVTTSVIDYRGIKSLLGIVVDLTAEKEYEKKLLNAAEKEKEANQLKSHFLVNMSHEIRTPMNAIIGLSEIELRKDIDKNARDVHRKISASARSLLQIINDILDLSKIEANKMEIINDEFDLEEVLDSSLLVAAPRIEGKEVEFTLNAYPDLPRYLVGDKARLWQILKNFLDNSAKFTEAGKIVLTVREEPEKSNRDTIWLTFIVEDTGIGMSDEQLNSVFMPYEQFSSEMHKKYSGTGLGMSIAKQLCEIMGGSLKIRSKTGAGTTISMSLPFKYAKRGNELISVKDPALSGITVLAVDDDELSLEIMSNLLRSNNINCVTARSGVEAMRTVFKYRDMGVSFDAVLLDYMMEGLDGVETARQIQMSLSKTPKLLMVTAHQRSLLSEEMGDSKIEDIIEKPFMPSKLISKLGEAIGISRAETAPEETFTGFNDANVLICEDNLLNQEVAVGMFKFFGVTPLVADNGKHALELLDKSGGFDLIFMDLQMPVMDGYEATAAIRADERFKNIPIISLSADAMSEVVEKCLAAGMNDHLAKPIGFEGLHNMMVKWLPEEKQSKDGRLKKPKPVLSPQEEALERFQGDVKLYHKALRSFAVNLRDDWPEFEEAAKNYKHTLIELHSLKGVAGNLGERDIQLSAERFEQSIKKGAPDIDLYNAFIAACSSSKKRILEQLENDAELSPAESGGAEELNSLLDEFEKALLDYDPVGATDVSDALSQKTWPVDERLLAQVRELAEIYEFDEALIALEALRSGVKERRQ